jgi:hypothetical protein
MYVVRFTIVTLVALLLVSNSAVGQWMGKQTECYADTIAANPNRPTVTNPAHVTQYGVLELEYGWDRIWPGEGIHQTSIGGLLKFGMLCDIELRWTTTSFLSQTDAGGTYRTFGDNWLGTEIRVHRQTRRLPTMAFSYAFKIPSANTENGLGTGRADHSFAFVASENIAHFNFDFNFTQFLIGGPSFIRPRQEPASEPCIFTRPPRWPPVRRGILWGDPTQPNDTGVRFFAVGTYVHSCSPVGD